MDQKSWSPVRTTLKRLPVTENTREKKYYTIGSVEKLCDLLEILSTQDSWDLNELADAMGLPKTTVHRFLLTLLDRGYVVQEKRRGRYSLSFKLFSIASRVVEQTSLVKVARPFEEHLRKALGETVNLTVPFGPHMLVIDKLVSPQALRQDVQLGSSFSIPCSASGRIYLAFSSSDDRARAEAAIRSEGSEEDKEKLPGILERIDEIRANRIEDDNEEQYDGIRCLSAAILDSSNRACAAISVSFPVMRFSAEIREAAKKELLEAARQISQRLGAAVF